MDGANVAVESRERSIVQALIRNPLALWPFSSQHSLAERSLEEEMRRNERLELDHSQKGVLVYSRFGDRKGK